MNNEEIKLIVKKYCTSARVTHDIMSEITPVFINDWMSNSLLIELHTNIYCKDETETRISYPSSWWQHVRQRFYPKWLLRRYPVKKEYHVVKYISAYPTIYVDKEAHSAVPKLIHDISVN